MRGPWLGLTVILLSGGISFASGHLPAQAGRPGEAADGMVLAQRHTPYARAAWVISDELNYMHFLLGLSHGGIRLRPRWEDYREFSGDLAHVAMPPGAGPAGQGTPNPGTLVASNYSVAYPVAVLLHRRLMQAAGGIGRKARPTIFMAGLGSGAGVSLLAHHFPQASLTVVEIDPGVVDMVLTHYPFLRWLAQQRTADGRPRLRLMTGDGRRAVRQAPRGAFDVLILDAYTLGATVPPHLMTREFYEELAAASAPDAILLANVIGSYTGPKRRLLGGAIRSLQAAGWASVRVFPLRWPQEPRDAWEDSRLRNCLVVAARQPLAPEDDPEGWRRLAATTLYPELPVGRYVTGMMFLAIGEQPVSTRVSLLTDGPPLAAAVAPARMRERLLRAPRRPVSGGFRTQSTDQTLIRQAQHTVRRTPGRQALCGWETRRPGVSLVYVETDAVQLIRDAFEDMVRLARRFGAVRGQADPPGEGFQLTRDLPLFTDQQPNADMIR